MSFLGPVKESVDADMSRFFQK